VRAGVGREARGRVVEEGGCGRGDGGDLVEDLRGRGGGADGGYEGLDLGV